MEKLIMSSADIFINEVYLEFEKDTLLFYPDSIKSQLSINKNNYEEYILDCNNFLFYINRNKKTVNGQSLNDLSFIVDNDMRLTIKMHIKAVFNHRTGEGRFDIVSNEVYSLKKGCLLIDSADPFYIQAQDKLKSAKGFVRFNYREIKL